MVGLEIENYNKKTLQPKRQLKHQTKKKRNSVSGKKRYFNTNTDQNKEFPLLLHLSHQVSGPIIKRFAWRRISSNNVGGRRYIPMRQWNPL